MIFLYFSLALNIHSIYPIAAPWMLQNAWWITNYQKHDQLTIVPYRTPTRLTCRCVTEIKYHNWKQLPLRITGWVHLNPSSCQLYSPTKIIRGNEHHFHPLINISWSFIGVGEFSTTISPKYLETMASFLLQSISSKSSTWSPPLWYSTERSPTTLYSLWRSLYQRVTLKVGINACTGYIRNAPRLTGIALVRLYLHQTNCNPRPVAPLLISMHISLPEHLTV